MPRIILFLLVLVGLLQYRLWFGDGNVLDLRRMQDRIVELQREGERRKQRNATLDAEVTDLKQGTEAIEERARQNLGMIREGEALVHIVDEERPAPPSGAAPAPGPARQSKKRSHPAAGTSKR